MVWTFEPRRISCLSRRRSSLLVRNLLILYIIPTYASAAFSHGNRNSLAASIVYATRKSGSPAHHERNTGSSPTLPITEVPIFHVDTDDILMGGIIGQRGQRGHINTGDEMEDVYQSTQVYGPIRPTSASSGAARGGDGPQSHIVARKRKHKRNPHITIPPHRGVIQLQAILGHHRTICLERAQTECPFSSHLKAEGDHLLKSLVKLGRHTNHGVCRAINVTGSTAAVVTGAVFKVVGAAVLDVVEGMELASTKSPTEIPGITEAYRFLKKGLKITGESVYDFGAAAENMTAEATEAAEETIRYVVESVIDTAAGSTGYLRDSREGAGPPGKKADSYFSDEEARIIDNMMLDISAPDDSERDELGYSGHQVAERRGTYDMAARESDETVPFDDPGVAGGRGKGQAAATLTSKRASSSGEMEAKATIAERARMAIRRSILRSNKAVPSMRFPQMVACGMVFACRTVTRNPFFCSAGFVGARMYLKFVEAIYLECLKERMMSDIKFEAVARLHEGSPERARWFNNAVGAMWVPMLEPLLARWVSRQITMVIERSLPSDVSWVGLGKVTLGPTPPKVRYVQVQNMTALAARKSMGLSNAVIDGVLLEAGQPGGDVTGEHVVYVELGVDWTSSRSKVSLKLGEQSRRRRNWWSVRSYVPSYRVKLCELGIQAKVVVALAFGEGRPYVKRLWLSFAEPPLTHLSLEALTGMDLANLPVLRRHLRHVVLRCLMPVTEPKHLALEIKPPPAPQPLTRRAALAARVRPAAERARRGFFRRVPGFGLRRLRNHDNGPEDITEIIPEGFSINEATGGQDKGDARRALEEATKSLLVEVGSGNREETVMAAAMHPPSDAACDHHGVCETDGDGEDKSTPAGMNTPLDDREQKYAVGSNTEGSELELVEDEKVVRSEGSEEAGDEAATRDESYGDRAEERETGESAGVSSMGIGTGVELQESEEMAVEAGAREACSRGDEVKTESKSTPKGQRRKEAARERRAGIRRQRKARREEMKSLESLLEHSTLARSSAEDSKERGWEVWWRRPKQSKRGVDDLIEKLKCNKTAETMCVLSTRIFGATEAIAFANALSSNTSLRELLASGHSLGVPEASAFGRAMHVNTTLQSLCLGDHGFGDEGVTALVDNGLKDNVGLLVLDLECKSISGGKALCMLLQAHRTLVDLRLGRNQLGEPALRDISLGLSQNSTLRRLDLSGNLLDAKAVVMLGCAISKPLSTRDSDAALGSTGGEVLPLESLNLSRNPLGDEGGAALFQALASCTSLRSLYVADAGLGTATATALSRALMPVNMSNVPSAADHGASGEQRLDAEGSPCESARDQADVASATRGLMLITKLDISKNDLGAAGTASLGEGFLQGGAPLLESLSMGYNGIGDEGAAALARAGGESLRVLDLCGNGLSRAGITSALSAPGLREAKFFHNACGDEGVPQVLEAVHGAKHLETLDLGANGLSGAGFEVFLPGLASCHSLRTLELGANSNDDRAEAAVRRSQSINPTLDIAFRRGGEAMQGAGTPPPGFEDGAAQVAGTSPRASQD